MSLSNKLIYGTMERTEEGEEDHSHEYMVTAIGTALDVGYRHFDMAEIYTTHHAVGRALSASCVKRAELFLISKLDGLPGSDLADYSSTKSRVQNMLNEVGVEYFDLLLLHYPLPSGTGAAMLSGDPSSISTPENWRVFSNSLARAFGNTSPVCNRMVS